MPRRRHTTKFRAKPSVKRMALMRSKPTESSVNESNMANRANDVLTEASYTGLEALGTLEKGWPGQLSPDVQSAFAQLREALKQFSPGLSSLTATSTSPLAKGGAGPSYFNALDLIRHVLKAQDLLFLSRQVTYHIVTSSDTPQAWADADQVQHAFSQIVEHLVRRAVRSSRLSISLSTFSLRNSPALEISFSNIDRNLSDVDHHDFLTRLFQDGIDDISGVSLSDCRQIAIRQQGQLWVDFPKPNKPVYHLVVPTSQEAAAEAPTAQQTFKYDISISNYADVRKRFGIRKSYSLVTQIEHYIRSLVRYPIDVVMALNDKGIITTIYETQRGTAQSVASRISQRLGSEIFRIGKKNVDLAFSYRLSPLSTLSSKGSAPTTRPSSH